MAGIKRSIDKKGKKGLDVAGEGIRIADRRANEAGHINEAIKIMENNQDLDDQDIAVIEATRKQFSDDFDRAYERDVDTKVERGEKITGEAADEAKRAIDAVNGVDSDARRMEGMTDVGTSGPELIEKRMDASRKEYTDQQTRMKENMDKLRSQAKENQERVARMLMDERVNRLTGK